MLQASANTLNALNQSTTLSMINGCWIEYNMNDLIEGTSITAPQGVITATLTAPVEKGGYTYKPFEKLFPITSIIDPRRPKFAGIQYMIYQDPSLSWATPSGVVNNYGSSKQFSQRLYFSSTKTAYKYWVTPKAATGSTSLSNCILTITYPAVKTAVTNKITVKFETSHGKPSSWSLKLLNLSGAESTIYTGTTAPDNGVVNLYYNGSSWTTSEFVSPSPGINLSGLKLQINSTSIAGGYIGVIEIAAKYVIDVTSSVESFTLNQNSSDSPSGVVPVGDVTSNALSLSLNSFDKTYEYYDKALAFDKTKINLYKNMICRPYVTVDSEKINLGVYYTDTFSVSEFGDIQITALDGARELQYIKPPDIVTKDMSSIAIIRRLLDSVGFTNYNINLATTDTSTITPYYWYSDITKTVWQHIQDICKDTQMVATFDQNDVLQFYPRDYIFANKPTQFYFRYDTKGSNLANIVSLGIENVPSVKAVKVIYSPHLTTAYLASADNLYTAPVITLGAGALLKDLPASAPAEDEAPLGVITLEPVFVSGEAKKLYSFNGYLILNDEIIEYDAIKYSYVELGTKIVKYKWIASDSDVAKYQGLSEPNKFEATSLYRIKTRNAFGVLDAPQSHVIGDTSSGWQGYLWDSAAGTFTTSSTNFTTQSFDKDKYNLYSPVAKSMLTLFSGSATEVKNVDPTKASTYKPNGTYSMVKNNDAKYLDSSSSNFIIGTSMYFPLVVDKTSKKITGNQMSVAGIAFGLSSDNKSGYMLTVATSQNVNGDKSYRDVNFYKIKEGKPVAMATSQRDTDGSIITNINGGELYRVDIKANKTIKDNVTYQTFKILLNNKAIAVTDTEPIDINSSNENVALLSLQGTCSFDYIYSSPLTEEEFSSKESFNLYKGFLGANSTIVKNFGDFVFQKGTKTDSKIWIKEFGPVARELKRLQSRYSNAPGFPRYAQIIQNPNATIVGTSLDSFTMDVFVMNNSGTFTELSNGQEKSFIVVGDQVDASDPFEYIDPLLKDIDQQEQIGFDSVWIQKESEAKSLANWITKQWSKQQKVLQVETFLNPLLQVGDIVEVSYPSNKIYSTEDSGQTASKYVILSIDSTYDSQSVASTQVICRSIYTG